VPYQTFGLPTAPAALGLPTHQTAAAAPFVPSVTYGLPAYSTPAAASTTNSPSSKKRRDAPGKVVKRRTSVKSE
jgi:hypothetical protein